MVLMDNRLFFVLMKTTLHDHKESDKEKWEGGEAGVTRSRGVLESRAWTSMTRGCSSKVMTDHVDWFSHTPPLLTPLPAHLLLLYVVPEGSAHPLLADLLEPRMKLVANVGGEEMERGRGVQKILITK